MALVAALQGNALAASTSCGQSGDVAARIADCHAALGPSASRTYEESEKVTDTWSLVSRDEDGSEIWRDDASGLTWMHAARPDMDHDHAIAACSELSAPGLPLELPAIADFRAAVKRGLESVTLSLHDNLYWTLTQAGSDRAHVYDSMSGYDLTDYFEFPHSVECVSRPAIAADDTKKVKTDPHGEPTRPRRGVKPTST